MIIESETDYREAMIRIDKLFDAYLNHDEAVEFNDLLEAIMVYEDKHYPLESGVPLTHAPGTEKFEDREGV